MNGAADFYYDNYVLDFSACCKEVFGTVYIDQEVFAEKMREFSAYRYDNNWISKETLSDWEAIIDENAAKTD